MKNFTRKILALAISGALLLTGCSTTEENPQLPEDNTSAAAQNPDEKTQTAEGTGENGSAGTDGTAAGGENPAAGTDAPQTPEKSSFTAEWKAGTTWEQGGQSCGTLEVTVVNNSGSALEGWTMKFNVPDGFEITAGWNGKFDVSGSVVTVTNESYNGEVADGGSFNVGFNYAAPSFFTPPPSITVNGTSGSSNTSSNNDNNQNNNQNSNQSSEQSTQPAVTEKPLPAPALVGLVKDHGKLSVKGTQLVDKNGDNFQLKGMSTHGIAWFPDFINENSFKTLRDDWNTNAVRIAMYTGEYNGYCSGGDKAYIKGLVEKGVDIATDLGMYVIIDWHILSDSNPQTNKAEAKLFFEEMSSKYKNYDNVLYEICNEPNGGTSWDNDIKPYAEEIIPIIRKNSPDSVIIVGTPTWSQDIDKALANPLSEKNVMYALHFYAATHTDWLRQRVQDCYNKGLPIFVSEFGCCDASGNGGNDFGQTKQWLELLDSCGISYMNWNLANKNESSSAFKESASANGNWKESDMNEGAIWLRKWFRGEN